MSSAERSVFRNPGKRQMQGGVMLLTLFAMENGGPTLSSMFGYNIEPPLDERYRTEKGYMVEIQLAAYPIEL